MAFGHLIAVEDRLREAVTRARKPLLYCERAKI